MIAMFHRLETVDGFVIKDASTLPDVSHKLISSLQTVDSVIVVTTSAVYHCRPRTSPEKLFFELAVNSADTSAADLLAITSGLDVNKLYQVTRLQTILVKTETVGSLLADHQLNVSCLLVDSQLMGDHIAAVHFYPNSSTL